MDDLGRGANTFKKHTSFSRHAKIVFSKQTSAEIRIKYGQA